MEFKTLFKVLQILQQFSLKANAPYSIRRGWESIFSWHYITYDIYYYCPIGRMIMGGPHRKQEKGLSPSNRFTDDHRGLPSDN